MDSMVERSCFGDAISQLKTLQLKQKIRRGRRRRRRRSEEIKIKKENALLMEEGVFFLSSGAS